LSEGAHVGYFRGKVKGSWSARYHCPIRAEYVSAVIGEAEDHREADCITILTYKQAVEKALRWIEMQSRGGGPVTESNPDMTIAEAVTAYIAVRDARRSSRAGRAVKSDASSNLTKFVLDDERLPAMKLSVLSEADLRDWQLRITRRKPYPLCAAPQFDRAGPARRPANPAGGGASRHLRGDDRAALFALYHRGARRTRRASRGANRFNGGLNAVDDPTVADHCTSEPPDTVDWRQASASANASALLKPNQIGAKHVCHRVGEVSDLT
jgi:hypothetical protein